MSRCASLAAVAALVLASLGAGCAGAVSERVIAMPGAAAALPEAVRPSRLSPELYTLYILRMQLGLDDEAPLILAAP